jgi:UDP-N-acetyl-D-glucosamine dehydrogenase
MNLKLAVIGQGYVGLPLALIASKSGFVVFGIDSDASKVSKLQRGVSPIEDVDSFQITEGIDSGSYFPTSDYSLINGCSVILICVPTPLNNVQAPDLSYLKAAATRIGEHLSPGSLVILESTVSPGTTRNFLVKTIEAASGLDQSEFNIAFSPERIDPLNRKWNIKNTPKIVSGLTENSTRMAAEFYAKFIDEVITVESLEIAETAKLLENSFRLVNISFINEIAIFCDELGIDITKVIQAAASKPYGFMPFYPGIGVGGHCIPVDPIYLSHKAGEIGASSNFIELAVKVNRDRPNYFVEKAQQKLGTLSQKKILVIGVAYKPNVSDTRETPVKALIDGLIDRGANVSWHDKLVKTWEGGQSAPLDDNYDLAIIATLHDSVDLSELGNTPIINTRNSV